MPSDQVTTLVNRVADMAIEQQQPASRVIASNGLMSTVKGAARAELARVGLTYMANNQLHVRLTANGRGSDVKVGDETFGDAPLVRQNGHPHPRDEEDVLLRVRLTTSDGQQLLSAIDMPVEELRHAVMECRSLASGWSDRAEAFDFAATACERRGVETLRELPDKELVAVRKKFERVWGGGA